MSPRVIVPLIDLVFLTLGSVLGAMTQMQRVEAVPVSVSEVGGGAAIITGKIEVLSLGREDLRYKGRSIERAEFASIFAGKQVLLRAERSLPTQQTLSVLAGLVKAGAEVSIEVEQAADMPAEGRGAGK